MSVLAVTVFVGFVLAGLFVILFVAQACGSHPPTERDALLPLERDQNDRTPERSHLP